MCGCTSFITLTHVCLCLWNCCPPLFTSHMELPSSCLYLYLRPSFPFLSLFFHKSCLHSTQLSVLGSMLCAGNVYVRAQPKLSPLAHRNVQPVCLLNCCTLKYCLHFFHLSVLFM